MQNDRIVTCTSILASAVLLCCSGADLPSPSQVGTAGQPSASAAGAGTASLAGDASSAGSPSYAGSAGSAAELTFADGAASYAGAPANTGNPIGSGGESAAAGSANATTTEPSNWTLAWSDEFDAADGTPPDASKWMHDTGGSGWGNQELEYYTEDTANSQQVGSNLVITATKDGAASHSCWNGACQFTSGRLLTSGHYATTYGKVEARIKMPAGKGMWPAFWMLGSNISTVSWPACGELDIMEVIGSDPAVVHGSMHGPGYSGANPLTANAKLPSGADLSDDFHVYSIEWAPAVVRFYLDNVLYETRTPADMPAGGIWVYDRPFFIILNMAVGGQWPGSPDANTVFPAKMLVDYVHVYSAK